MLLTTNSQKATPTKPITPSTISERANQPSLSQPSAITKCKAKNHRVSTYLIPKDLDSDDIVNPMSQGQSFLQTKSQFVSKSAITKHYLTTGYIITKENFGILVSDSHRYRLLLKESLSILKNSPKLNGIDRFIPLYVFPDDLPLYSSHSKSTSNASITKCLFNASISQTPRRIRTPFTASSTTSPVSQCNLFQMTRIRNDLEYHHITGATRFSDLFLLESIYHHHFSPPTKNHNCVITTLHLTL